MPPLEPRAAAKISLWRGWMSLCWMGRSTAGTSTWSSTTTGYSPARLPQTLLWFAFGSELLDQDLAGSYQLEPVAGSGPPWVYVWIDNPPG
jgi:hypothetical protein